MFIHSAFICPINLQLVAVFLVEKQRKLQCVSSANKWDEKRMLIRKNGVKERVTIQIQLWKTGREREKKKAYSKVGKRELGEISGKMV